MPKDHTSVALVCIEIAFKLSKSNNSRAIHLSEPAEFPDTEDVIAEVMVALEISKPRINGLRDSEIKTFS